ncbi:CDP-alcohol phosphatidyltransferase family protein [bacterium]|nr:CDP-alcohol phosphatidyltransferase family protein [candidate division CSSED10-310 bacterium]
MFHLPESVKNLNRTRFFSVMAVTLVRIPLALAFSTLYLTTDRIAYRVWFGLILLVLIEVSDGLDGFLARKFKVVSEVGAMFDPYTDSFSRLVVYYTFAVSDMALMAVPLVMALRDVTVAYCRIVLTRRRQSVAALRSGKIKAVVQGSCAFVLCLSPLFRSFIGPIIYPIVSWLVIIVTTASCLEYMAAAYRSVSR